MVVIEGLCIKDQHALVSLLDVLVGMPQLDAETVRRAQYLKWHLEGFDPLTRLEIVNEFRAAYTGRAHQVVAQVATLTNPRKLPSARSIKDIADRAEQASLQRRARAD